MTSTTFATMSYPNGVLHSYTYDPKDQLSGLQVGKVPGVFANYTQTYGDAGHKTTVAELGGRSETYGYDQVYRLLSETIAGDPNTANNGALNYVLDAVANRRARTSTLAALGAQNSTFDVNDRLSSDTYDSNGNTLTSGTSFYSYDFENRLTSFNNGAITMVYDGDGNRVSKTAGGVTITYLVDDFTPTAYPQVAEELTGASVQRRYTHGLMRISETAGAVTSYYGYDAGGSVRQLNDVAGAVTDAYSYDAFGNLVASTGATLNAYLYRGEQYEAGLGLYYLRARWYSPQSGRFITRDTWERPACEPENGSNKDENLYVYGGSDPADRIDPTGHNSGSETAVLEGFVSLALRASVALAISATAVCALEAASSVLGIEILSFTNDIVGVRHISQCLFTAQTRQRRCAPCIPPVGTLGYRVDLTQLRPHFDQPTQTWIPAGVGHWHLYVVMQSPPVAGCRCWWSDGNAAGFFPPAPAGAVLMTGPVGGGGFAP